MPPSAPLNDHTYYFKDVGSSGDEKDHKDKKGQTLGSNGEEKNQTVLAVFDDDCDLESQKFTTKEPIAQSNSSNREGRLEAFFHILTHKQ